MEIKFRLEYELAVAKVDIPRLSHPAKLQIKRAIEDKLATKPEVFGKPLRRSLKGYRSLRVGDYRVIFRICLDEDAADGGQDTVGGKEPARGKNTAAGAVKIFAIMHRSVAYKTKRLN